jgi:hypothetical protein
VTLRNRVNQIGPFKSRSVAPSCLRTVARVLRGRRAPFNGKELFLRVFLQTIQKENQAKESEYSRAATMRDRMMGRSKKLKEFQHLIHRTDENRNRDLKKQTEGVQLENDNLP